MEKIAKNLQLVLMVIILISTVIAVGIEMNKMFLVKSVTLADLLLMFLYLEVLAMVRVFWDQQLYYSWSYIGIRSNKKIIKQIFIL